MYEDKGEMRNERRSSDIMVHSCCTAGSTHSSQLYVHGICYILCSIIHIIPFHGVPGIETVYMCMRDVQQREICERIVTLLQQ